MRKVHILIILMVAGLVASAQAWRKIDNFNGYAAGDAATVTGGVWSSETNDSTIEITADGTLKITKLAGSADWDGSYMDLTGTDAALAVGETKTYFWQVSVHTDHDTTSWTYDCMMGLSPETSNIDQTNAWSDFAVMPFVNNAPATPYINAAADGTYWAPMTMDTWTNVWVVVNNDETAPTYDLYYSTGEDAAVLVAANAYWRGSESGIGPGSDLNAIGFMAAGWDLSSYTFDNVYCADGEDLTIPADEAPYDPAVLPDNGDGTVGTLNGSDADVELTFKAGPDPNEVRNAPFNPDILTHYIYHTISNTDANFIETPISVPQVSETDPNVSYSMTLDQGTYYEWYVEEGLSDGVGGVYGPGDPNNIVGPVWSFVTIAAKPTLTGPNYAVADASGNATMTVGYSSTAETFQWFDGATDAPLTEGGLFTGTQTSTLTITGATLADEGEYYCVAYFGMTASDPAIGLLWTHRLAGYWKFDGDMTDSVTDEVTGAPTHDGSIADSGWADPETGVPGDAPGDPNYVGDGNGISGDAMSFHRDNDYVVIEDSDFFNFFGGGFTFNLWYQHNVVTAWALPMCKLDIGSGGWLFGVDANPYYTFIIESPWTGVYGDSDVTVGDGQWHMMTVTYDPVDTVIRLYTDGAEDSSVTADLSSVPLASAPLTIGAVETGLSIDGAIDEVKIWTYPLDQVTIAEMYTGFRTDEYVCVTPEGSELPTFDLTEDCRVNLEDFALVASEWLECQRIPVDSCDW